MKGYLLSLLAASLCVALVGILAPSSSQKYIRFIASLFLICVLVAPLPRVLSAINESGELPDLIGGNVQPPSDYEERMEEALEQASGAYFAETLTQLIEERFSIPDGSVRCTVKWNSDGDKFAPERVTVILSGSAIWKNPSEIEAFVSSLLGCECISAIES